MARDPSAAKKIGNQIAKDEISFGELAEILVRSLRTPPPSGRLENALSHMWGYVSEYSEIDPSRSTSIELLKEIQVKARQFDIDYLLRSTALAELMLWSRSPHS